MKRNFLFILVALLITTLPSCKHHDDPGIDYSGFLNCTNSHPMDSSSTARQLVGEWQMDQNFCETSGLNVYDVKLSFDSIGNFIEFDQGSPYVTCKWSLSAIDSVTFQLKLTVPSQYTYGTILLCSNSILFLDSPSDGCDNEFSRVQ